MCSGSRPRHVCATPMLIPILRDHYGRVLEAGELKIVRRGAEFEVRYEQNAYCDWPSLGPILGRAARLEGSDALAFLADAFSELAANGSRPPACDDAIVTRRCCANNCGACSKTIPSWPRPSIRSSPI